MNKPLLIKGVAAVVALGAFAFLFMRSLQDTRTEPYTVPVQHLRSWQVGLEPARNPNDPLLVLRPAPELTSGLFKQIFARSMESLNTPTSPSVPLILRSEFDGVVGDRLTQDGLVAAARAAGVETAPTPRCLVHRHESEPGRVRQVYFIHLDAPAIAQFRRQLGLDAEALSPILFVAGAGAEFNTWLPQRVAETDCLAPIEVAD
jgi:hypothetical protein